MLWQKLPSSGYWRDVFWISLFLLWLPPSLIADHFMILLGMEGQAERGWVSGPAETVIALSIPFYALIALFFLVACAFQRRDPASD
jgi:hypothetical protein